MSKADVVLLSGVDSLVGGGAAAQRVQACDHSTARVPVGALSGQNRDCFRGLERPL